VETNRKRKVQLEAVAKDMSLGGHYRFLNIPKRVFLFCKWQMPISQANGGLVRELPSNPQFRFRNRPEFVSPFFPHVFFPIIHLKETFQIGMLWVPGLNLSIGW